MVSVKFCVALVPTPLLAVMVIIYMPPVPAAGVPESVPVPLPLSTNVTPEGSEPVLLRLGLGLPVVVTVRPPAVPVVKVALPPLVIVGRAPTVTVSLFDTAAVVGLVCTTSPPPQASAVLLTDVGEVAGIFTVSVMTELLPPAMPGVAAQVTTFVVLLQVHRLDVEV